MSFLNPWAFLGLLSLPVIIGMHLHLARTQRVVVSSMFLWAFLDEKYQGSTPKFIRISWLLLLDLLIAIMLAFALAKPVIKLPAIGQVEFQQIILIDDSLSMLGRDADPTRFSVAQALAVSLIEEAGWDNESVVITMGGQARMIGSSRLAGQDELLNAVRGLRPSGMGVDLRAALSAARSATRAETPVIVYALTDGAFDLPYIKDFPYEIQWVFVGFEGNNQAVTGIDLTVERDGQAELFFKVVNFGNSEAARMVEIWVDGGLLRTDEIRIGPRAEAAQVIVVPGKASEVEVRLLGNDFLPGDDVAVVGAPEGRIVRVAVVGDDPAAVGAALEVIPGTRTELFSGGEALNGIYDLNIFINRVPAELPEDGITLILGLPPDNQTFPIFDSDPDDAPPVLSADPVLSGVDLKAVRWRGLEDGQPGAGVDLVAEVDNKAVFLRGQGEWADVYVLVPDINQSNFARLPVFPVFFANFVELARGFTPENAYLLGTSLDLASLQELQSVMLLTPADGEVALVSGDRILFAESGRYQIIQTDALGAVAQAVFGVNSGDREESDLTPQPWRAEQIAAQTVTGLERQPVEVRLGPWLLLTAALLLVLEAWRAWR